MSRTATLEQLQQPSVGDDQHPDFSDYRTEDESTRSTSPSTTINEGRQCNSYTVYTRRWYILLLYSLIGLMQGYLWNMWGPIYHSMEAVYGKSVWNKRQLALMPFYGTIVFTIFVMPSAWMLEKIKLRKTMQLMAFTTMLGCLIRCYPFDTETTTILMNISAIINAFPGIVTFYIPAVISAQWFPTNERKLSTALGTLLNGLGVSGAFFVGPLIVHEPTAPGATVETMKWEYFQYTWLQSGVTTLLFIAVCIYFPDAPPSPPSESSEVARIDYIAGCKKLFASRDFWIISTPMTLVFGTFSAWLPVVTADLKGASQDTAAMVGFYASFAGMVVGIAVGKMADYFGHLKAIHTALVFLSLEASIWILLVTHDFIPYTITQIYIAAIIYGSAAYAILPINMELAAEVMYPVDEALVVGLLGMLPNLINTIFLAILFFPSISVVWMDYFTSIAALIAVPFAFLMKEEYKRTAVDNQHQNDISAKLERDRSLSIASTAPLVVDS